MLLQMAVVYLPFLNTAFSTTPLQFSEWLLAIVAGSAVLWVGEAHKLVKRLSTSLRNS